MGGHTLPRGLKARRVAEGSGFETFFQEAGHLVDLVGRGGALVEARDGYAQVAVGDEGGDVDRGLRCVEGFEVSGERAPSHVQAGVVAVDVGGEQGRGGDRGAAVAAVADELGGHALIDGALGAGVDEKGEVGVAVDIDEAGGYDEALGVDLVVARRLVEGAYVLDLVACDADISGAGGAT